MRKKKRKRRSAAELARLSGKIIGVCARQNGSSMRAISRALRQPCRVLKPAMQAAVSSGALIPRGAGRAAIYHVASSAPAPGPLDALVVAAGGEIGLASRMIGVDRRTLYRWRRGGTLPDFQRLRIAALLGAIKSSGRGNPPASHNAQRGALKSANRDRNT